MSRNVNASNRGTLGEYLSPTMRFFESYRTNTLYSNLLLRLKIMAEKPTLQTSGPSNVLLLCSFD